MDRDILSLLRDSAATLNQADVTEAAHTLSALLYERNPTNGGFAAALAVMTASMAFGLADNRQELEAIRKLLHYTVDDVAAHSLTLAPFDREPVQPPTPNTVH